MFINIGFRAFACKSTRLIPFGNSLKDSLKQEKFDLIGQLNFAQPKWFQQVRKLSVHEYQSQSLMKPFGINVPSGQVASTVDEAGKIAREMKIGELVVKAQILAGGRGLGTFENGFKGGVQLCSSPEEVMLNAERMLGKKLITKQTGPEGKLVNKVLVVKRYHLKKESYFAILLDRSFGGTVIVASSQGGVDIEKIASENPSAIIKERINVIEGPSKQQTEKIAKHLGFSSSNIPVIQEQINHLFQFFVKKDVLQVEINPLAETSEGEVMCMDAKVNFDSNALFRHPDIAEMDDPTQKDPREVEASKFDLNYVGLTGSIGCLVNGAGLAMATMDLIQLHGGQPANFLDIGGGASKQQVIEAIKILSHDRHVKTILVNIFGGIMRCDIIALGLIAAVKELSLKIPLIVRLQGTNVAEAKKIMSESGLRILSADDLDEAALKAVNAAQILKIAENVGLDVSFELPL